MTGIEGNTLLVSLAIWESNEQYTFFLQLYLTSTPAHGHETAFSNSLLVMAHTATRTQVAHYVTKHLHSELSDDE